MSKVKKKKEKVEPYNNNGICTYCEAAFSIKNDNLCQSCRDMITKVSKGFII